MKKLLVALLGLAFAQSLFAVNPVPYTLGVSFSFRLAGTGTGLMTVYDEVGTPVQSLSTSGTTAESGISLSWMKPGKEYFVNFQGSGASEYWLSFITPTGYQLWVDGFPRDIVDYVTGGGSYNTTRSLVLRPIGGGGRMNAGAFSGIDIGKSISWDVGLGSIRSGHSMGLVSFREVDLSNSPSSRDRLIYTALTGTFQCSVVRDGTSNLTLRQIAGAQTAVDFVDDGSGGYWMKFYTPSQATWSPPVFTFTGSPWRTIHVESPGLNQLKITETEGTASRVSLLSLNSGATLATGGTVTTSGTDTVHTFTSTSGGTFTVNPGLLSVQALVVAGGGGGGTGLLNVMNGGGGGGGGVLYNSALGVSASAYSITVGAGGPAGTNGGNSVFSSMTAIGGGHGASAAYAAPGASGGSGGGEGTAQGGGAGAGTSGQGGAGAAGAGSPNWQGGGGGGANGPATSITGGYGVAYTISGTTGGYGGGGGGAISASTGAGAGGPGGGGAGGSWSSYAGTNGTANTGGGGGGACHLGATGGSGGSGIVIIRYPSSGAVTTGNYGWTLKEGDGTTWLRTTVHTSTQYSGYREDIVVVRTGDTSGTVVAKTKYRYEHPGTGADDWGEELIKIIKDPDTKSLTTTFEYHASSANPGNYRRIKSVTDATNNWTAYTYYDTPWNLRGQLECEYHPYLNGPSTATTTSPSTSRVVCYDYAPDWTGRYNRPSLRQENINGVLTGKKVWTYDNSSNSPNWGRDKADVDSYSDGSNYHRDRTETIQVSSTEEGGEPAQMKGANLVHTVWNRSGGTYSSGVFTPSTAAVPNYRELVIHGSTSSSGATAESAYDSQSFDTIYVIPNKSTMEVSIRDQAGNVIHTENRVYTGSSTWALVNYMDYTFDGAGRLTQQVASGSNATIDYTYTNGLLQNTVDETGTETDFTYDKVWRVHQSTKKHISSGPGDISTTYTYNGSDQVTQTDLAGTSTTLTSSAQFDLAGRQTQSVVPGGSTGTLTTGIVPPDAGTNIVTFNLPGGATKITESYLDGQPKSATGTAVVNEFYTYTVNSGGTITRQVNYASASSAVWVKTTNDFLGRPIEERRPGWSGSDAIRTWFYNSSNQLYKFTQPDMAGTLYGYDTLGAKNLEVLDLNANGTFDPASDDRSTYTDSTIFTWDGGASWWKQTATYVCATPGSGTSTLTGYTRECLKLSANQLEYGYSVDIYGNQTAHATVVDRTNAIVTKYYARPDSTTTAAQVIYNGLLAYSNDCSGITTTYGYDDLARQIYVTDPRKGTTTTSFQSGTNQVASISLPNSTTVFEARYTYDSAGRVSVVKDALGKDCNYLYTTRNEKYRVWGDTVNPVEYHYDAFGNQDSLKTYRAGADWNGASPGTADITTWNFDTTTHGTNLLISKTDATTHSVSYTYFDSGRIHTRTWARSVGVTPLSATYVYYAGTGELHTVTYSDSTPGLTYTYSRLGQIATVVDATGSRTFNYNLGGTLELLSEDMPAYFGSRRITYPIASSGVIGRSTGVELGTSSNATADQNVAYAYDTYGRLYSIGAASKTFVYGYTTYSDLVSGITETSGSGWSQARTYQSHRDLPDYIDTTVSSTSKAKFTYLQDDLGRTTSIRKTGELYSLYENSTPTPLGLTSRYGYDDRSQVTSDVTYIGTSTTNKLPGREDAYAYDTFGNRASSAGTTHNGHTADYTTNALNQYTSRTVPGYFDVAGFSSASTVDVGRPAGTTDHTVARSYQYFFDGYGLVNTSTAVYDTTITITPSGGTPITRDAFLTKTPEFTTTSYDEDGNLVSDGRWTYTYDAENRLITMETNGVGTSSQPTNLTKQKLSFTYDYLGRRVGKIVQNWSGSSYASPFLSLVFVYNGWNVMAELNALTSNSVLSSHYWGLDIAGPGQTAGGVGALLMTQQSSNTYLPIYDGNGNVHGLINASSGSIDAAYEYDAFGNTLRESGTFAASNNFRFSTKYADLETSLVYYGTRFYSPSQGRFINRDSIEEQGGLNLYAFVGNNGVNGFDVLGRDDFRDTTTWESVGTSGDDFWASNSQSMYPSWELYAESQMAAASAAVSTKMALALAGTDAQKQEAANWFGSSANDITVSGSIKSGSFTIAQNGVIQYQAAIDHTTGQWLNVADNKSNAAAGAMVGVGASNSSGSASRARNFAAGTFMLAGGMVADDATGIGIADDPAIPFVIGGGLVIAGGIYIYDHVHPPAAKSKEGSDKTKQSKPKNAPPGTKPIDQWGLPKDDIHDIKEGVKSGPKDWTGMTPGGDILTTGPDGNYIDHGPKDSYIHGGGP